MERIGEKMQLSDSEKVLHLEGWIRTIIEHCRPSSGNPIIDNAQISSIKSGLKEALEYDTRQIVIRWYV